MEMRTLTIEDIKAIAEHLDLVLEIHDKGIQGTNFILKTLELEDPDIYYELYKHNNYEKQELNRKRRNQFKKGFNK